MLMAKTLLASFFLAVLGRAKAEAENSTSAKPHIVFFLADDWGWNDVGYRRPPGDKEIVTPNIDNLVQEGIELNRHYTYHYCTPTRSSLQSGRLPVHVSWGFDDPLRVNLEDPITGMSGIPRNMTGIAEKLREGGYRTHITGKWDAGMAYWEQTPMGRGYETFFGYYHHATDYYTHRASSWKGPDVCGDVVDLWNTTGPARDRNGTDYIEELFTENSLGILDRHDPNEPLLLFHSFHIVHSPLQVPKNWEDLFAWVPHPARRKYVAMVHYMDHVVGLIVAKLKSKMMWENTLVVMSSDNGGQTTKYGANNQPLRGGKLSDLEGGIRVNAFASGGAIPHSKRGTKLDDYIHVADWYATFCAIAGVDMHDEKAEAAGLPPVDGIDHSALLLKSVKEAPPGSGQRTEIHHAVRALTRGQWKLITGGELDVEAMRNESAALGGPWVVRADYLTGYEDHYPHGRSMWCDSGCLFDIQADPIEAHDVAEEYPEIVEHMKQRLAELNANNLFVNRGQASRDGCARWPGFYGPWLATEGHGLEDNFNFV